MQGARDAAGVHKVDWCLCGLLAALRPCTKPNKAVLKHIGWLSGRDCQIQDGPFNRRLGELGWTMGQNYDVECVSTAGHLDQLPALARELVSRRPDVIIAYPTSFIKALKQETTTIPIVMFATPDPIGPMQLPTSHDRKATLQELHGSASTYYPSALSS
jgi:ABC transporter substrate binding protein